MGRDLSFERREYGDGDHRRDRDLHPHRDEHSDRVADFNGDGHIDFYPHFHDDGYPYSHEYGDLLHDLYCYSGSHSDLHFDHSGYVDLYPYIDHDRDFLGDGDQYNVGQHGDFNQHFDSYFDCDANRQLYTGRKYIDFHLDSASYVYRDSNEYRHSKRDEDPDRHPERDQ